MTTSLQMRVRRLEDAAGGGSGCEHCSGSVAVVVNGRLESVTKDGRRLEADEEEDFLFAEEPGGRCPVCGESFASQEVTVGSWG
jgi:hypothetical protein